MRRILQSACFLSGALALLLTGWITVARREATQPLHWMILKAHPTLHYDKNALYLLEPHSGQLEQLTPAFPVMGLIDAADDGWFYYLAKTHNDPGSVYRVLQGGRPQQVVNLTDGWFPAWSPDAKWLVVNRPIQVGGQVQNHWYSLRRSDGRETNLTQAINFSDLTIANLELVFSPDSEWVAFEVSTIAGDVLDVYRVRLDGTGFENLTAELDGEAHLVGWLAGDVGLVVWQTPSYEMYALPPYLDSWQEVSLDDIAVMPEIWQVGPDKIAYSGRGSQLRVLDGRTWELLWKEGSILLRRFSPSGAWVLLVNYLEAWIIRRGDGSERQLVIPPFSSRIISQFAWSPDESQVALVSDNLTTGRYELWVYNLVTGEFKMLWETTLRTFSIFWSPDGKHLLGHAYAGPSQTTLIWMEADGSDLRELHLPRDLIVESLDGWGSQIAFTASMRSAGLASITLLGVSVILGRRAKN